MRDTTNALVFFVCGTPSNKGGFEFSTIGPGVLPGHPPTYLDQVRWDNYPYSRYYAVEAVQLADTTYAMYVEYRALNPNDEPINRGAYIGVGFLVDRPLSIDNLSIYLAWVAEIFGHLNAFMEPTNCFRRDFKLRDYEYPPLRAALEDNCLLDRLSVSLVADVTYQAAHGVGLFVNKPKRITLDSREFDSDEAGDRLRIHTSGDKKGLIRALERQRRNYEQLAKDSVSLLEVISREFEEERASEAMLCKALEEYGQVREQLRSSLKGLLERGLTETKVEATDQFPVQSREDAAYFEEKVEQEGHLSKLGAPRIGTGADSPRSPARKDVRWMQVFWIEGRPTYVLTGIILVIAALVGVLSFVGLQTVKVGSNTVDQPGAEQLEAERQTVLGEGKEVEKRSSSVIEERSRLESP